MSKSKIEFVRASNAPIEKLDSFILEAYVDNKEIAEVFNADTRWRVRMSSIEGVVDLLWEDFLEIAYEFSKFVSQESEFLLNKKDDISTDD
jgi:hypothetical protein